MDMESDSIWTVNGTSPLFFNRGEGMVSVLRAPDMATRCLSSFSISSLAVLPNSSARNLTCKPPIHLPITSNNSFSKQRKDRSARLTEMMVKASPDVDFLVKEDDKISEPNGWYLFLLFIVFLLLFWILNFVFVWI